MLLSLPPLPLYAVALSGGPDSWALALMAQEQGLDFVALIVDHRLRPESTAEAQQVAAECAKRNIRHHILTWEHDSITSRIQERARDARYTLLIDYCKQHGIPALLTAHHADDQMETILLRLAKASDVGGLGGLRPETVRDGITILRPLLAYTKQQLVDYAIAKDVPFVTDPGNTKDVYARGRLRNAADILASEGLNPAVLQRFAAKMHDVDTTLAQLTDTLITSHAAWANPCVLELSLQVLTAQPPLLQARALAAIWRRVTGNAGYAPDGDTLQNALSNITTKQTFGGIVMETTDGTLRFYRELQAVGSTVMVAPHGNVVWDNRFRIINGSATPITVGALGDVSTATLEKTCPWAAAIRPAAARATLPAVNQMPVSLGKDADSAIYAQAV